MMRPEINPPTEFSMQRPLILLICLFSALMSCAVSEDNFSYRYAQIWCKKWKSCDKEEFNQAFDRGVTQCEEDGEYLIDTFLNLGYALGGSYDAESAGDCIADLKQADCDELRELPGSSTSCDDVVD